MTDEDEINTNNFNDFIFLELHDAFYELLDNFKNLSLKNQELRMLNHSLI